MESNENSTCLPSVAENSMLSPPGTPPAPQLRSQDRSWVTFTWYEPVGRLDVTNSYVPSPSPSCSSAARQSGCQSPGQPSSDWKSPASVYSGPSALEVNRCDPGWYTNVTSVGSASE